MNLIFMRRYFLLFILVTSCTAQTKAPVKSHALRQCEASLQLASEDVQNRDIVAEGLTADNAKFTKANDELTAKNAELTKKNDELRVAALDVLKYTTQLDHDYRNMLLDYGSLVDRYNSVLERANSQIDAANARLNRQNQINNALMIYSLMPEYTPPPLQIYQPPTSLQIHCTSNRIGETVYTNCN